jgi:adenylate cyclase class 2
MAINLEFKAYCADLERAHAVCRSLGAELIREHDQVDTYFAIHEGRLKLRESDRHGTSLIHYRRLDTPLPKESDFEIVPVAADQGRIIDVLRRAIGVSVIVSKHRATYRLDQALVNLDTVDDLGTFIEVEVDADALRREGEGAVPPAEVVRRLELAFGLSPADLLPWSYADLKVMQDASRRWRPLLPPNPPIFLLDGASCTGKTTLATRLSQRPDLRLSLVPRYSTRKPRGGPGAEPEYIFVSPREFRELAMAGSFIEYRDFMFGMSYGLPWEQTISPVLHGERAIGIIDLGNVRHVKSVLPEAVTILIEASADTLRRRLLARGYNRTEEIEERLENARKVKFYEGFYDHVVQNDEGMLEQAEEQIAAIVSGARRR